MGRLPILPFIVQVLLLYILVRTGMLAVMGKVMLYCLLLIPLLWPILGAVGRYLVVPGQCPNCGVAFRAVRGKKTFACPACRAPIVLDGKSFVRAGPSWDQAAGAAGAAAAAAGAQAGAAGPGPGGARGPAWKPPQGARAADQEGRLNYSASQDVIDVEVLEVQSIDDGSTNNGSKR